MNNILKLLLKIALVLLICATQAGNLNAQSADTAKIEQVDVTVEDEGTSHDHHGAQLKTLMSENEFKKAACCTLSESFELSNAVEVSNSDGITGIKQVEMMGLNSKYILLTRDNLPQFNGIVTLNGLSNIPGDFVSDVRIAKGVGSATLGFEGITGGIDYALKSKHNEPRFHFNVYQNDQGRTEVNSIIYTANKKNWKNFTYLHSGQQWMTTDRNKDGFSDMPMTDRIYLGNHSDFQTKNLEGKLGATFWNDKKLAGVTNSIGGTQIDPNSDVFNFKSNESRLDVYAKLGIIPSNSENTFGNILNLSVHNMDYNLMPFKVSGDVLDRKYQAREMRFSYSGLYQAELTENWGLKTGISTLFTQLAEEFTDVDSWFYVPSSTKVNNEFNEIQLGAFAEWVYNSGNLTMVGGIRTDYHNLFGWYATPRLHGKWEFNPNNKLFFQGGYARRSPYVFAEHLPNLISNRSLYINSMNVKDASLSSPTFGLEQERGWNMGISYYKNFMFMEYPSSITIDVFQTLFDYQIVIDREAHPYEINISGRSKNQAGYTRSVHVEWSFTPLKRTDVKFAYRFIDNQKFIAGQLRMNPFQSAHRGLITLHHKTRNNWYFDGVFQLNGPKRLINLVPFNEQVNNSPWFTIFNFQTRKSFSKKFETYLGIENVFNFMQNDPILNMPLITLPPVGGDRIFDAAFNWAPANGRMFYIGLRYDII